MSEQEYPEHDKLKALGGANQIVGDFIEWLGEQGLTICEFNPQRFCGDGEFLPSRKNTVTLIGDFFEIDNNKLMAEKDAMLDAIRAANAA